MPRKRMPDCWQRNWQGLGLGIMRVSAVDYNISRLQIGEQAVQHIIHWFAGLDHDQDLTGFFQSGT